MKLDLNKPILNLEGIELEGVTMAKVVANALANAGQGDAIKFLDWALQLHKGQVLELDKSDFDTLKNFVQNAQGLTVLAKGRILPEIQAQKDSQK